MTWTLDKRTRATIGPLGDAPRCSEPGPSFVPLKNGDAITLP